MHEIDRDFLLGLPVPDFMTQIMLRRVMHAHDIWSKMPDSQIVAMAIFHSAEFIERNTAFGDRSEVLTYTEMRTTFSARLIERIYQSLLGRSPTASEVDALSGDEYVHFGDVCSRICWSRDFLSRIGSGAQPDRSYKEIRDDLVMYSKYFLMDHYSHGLKNVLTDKDHNSDRIRRIARADEIELHVTLYNTLGDDLDYVLEKLHTLFPEKRFSIHLKTEAEAADSDFSDRPSIFITNNNFLYHRGPDIMSKLGKYDNLVSACWLFDNHHQFNFSILYAEHFDVVFPAHCNGTEYLYGRKALIAPVVPCPVIQWSRSSAIELYATLEHIERDDELYGRFSSYDGRITARDKFLNLVGAEDFGRQIVSLKPDRQDWDTRTPAERFQDFMSHKVSVTTPINNDISLRVFDALLTGQIPILPYGALGLAASIPNEQQSALPVRAYLPNDVDSLRLASENAVAAFDRGGAQAAAKRHRYAADNHMLCHRVIQMVGEIMNLADA